MLRLCVRGRVEVIGLWDVRRGGCHDYTMDESGGMGCVRSGADKMEGWIGEFVEAGLGGRKSSSKGDKLHAQVEMHGSGIATQARENS